MLTGAHFIIFSKRPNEDRAFLRDVLKLPNVDSGDGWLIFGLPPSEVAVHPADINDKHKHSLMCDDVETFIAEMKQHDIEAGPVQEEDWGLVTQVTLPGGGELDVYQPLHPRPETTSE